MAHQTLTSSNYDKSFRLSNHQGLGQIRVKSLIKHLFVSFQQCKCYQFWFLNGSSSSLSPRSSSIRSSSSAQGWPPALPTTGSSSKLVTGNPGTNKTFNGQFLKNMDVKPLKLSNLFSTFMAWVEKAFEKPVLLFSVACIGGGGLLLES